MKFVGFCVSTVFYAIDMHDLMQYCLGYGPRFLHIELKYFAYTSSYLSILHAGLRAKKYTCTVQFDR